MRKSMPFRSIHTWDSDMSCLPTHEHSLLGAIVGSNNASQDERLETLCVDCMMWRQSGQRWMSDQLSNANLPAIWLG